MNPTIVTGMLSTRQIIDIAINEDLKHRNGVRCKFNVLRKRVVYQMIFDGNSFPNLDVEVDKALIYGIYTNKWLHEDNMGIMRTCDIQQGGATFISLPTLSAHTMTWNADKNQWEMSPVAPTATLQPNKVGPTVAINNHTCPTCSETRVSKTERTCWKCGNLL